MWPVATMRVAGPTCGPLPIGTCCDQNISGRRIVLISASASRVYRRDRWRGSFACQSDDPRKFVNESSPRDVIPGIAIVGSGHLDRDP